MQLLIDPIPSGAAVPHSENAHVIEVDPADTASARASAIRSVDDILGRVATGWTPTMLSAADSAKAADERVKVAKVALDEATAAAATAHKDADEATEEAAEPDNAPAKTHPAATGYTGTEHRKNTTKRRQTDTGNATGANRRTGKSDRRTPAQA